MFVSVRLVSDEGGSEGIFTKDSSRFARASSLILYSSFRLSSSFSRLLRPVRGVDPPV
jgi:hypothetical protein